MSTAIDEREWQRDDLAVAADRWLEEQIELERQRIVALLCKARRLSVSAELLPHEREDANDYINRLQMELRQLEE